MSASLHTDHFGNRSKRRGGVQKGPSTVYPGVGEVLSPEVPRHFDRARYHALPAAAPASRMIPASCGSPGREPRNPARDVGPEILVLRSERVNEHRLLVPHDKGVEGEPHQHTVRKKALVAEQGRLA